VCDDIRGYLQQHPAIDTTQTLIVNFNRFGASSLDIMVYAFTLTRAWAEYQKLKQELLLAMGGIIERHGAQIAFPTQTLHLATGAGEADPPLAHGC
jgi:MscS family membrane protein